TDIALLSSGIVGVVCFLLVFLVVVRSYGFNFLNADPVFSFYDLIFVFCMLVPIAFAISGILRARTMLRTEDGVFRQQSSRVLLLIAALVFAVPASRVLAQELVMLWYGRSLYAAAYASAQDIAGGA